MFSIYREVFRGLLLRLLKLSFHDLLKGLEEASNCRPSNCLGYDSVKL